VGEENIAYLHFSDELPEAEISDEILAET